MTTQLTPHFTLEELIRSETADALKIKNTPTPAHRKNLELLAKGLEEARGYLGVPMIVTSGYRNPAVNRAVGGVSNSAHALGLAADFTTLPLTPKHAGEILAASPMQFDQLIWEVSRGILHLAFDTRMRRQVLTQPLGPGTPVHNGLG